MMLRHKRFIRGIGFCTFLILLGGFHSGQALSPGAPTVEDRYPGLASQALRLATLAKLKKGVLLNSGKVVIKESEIDSLIERAKPEIRPQLSQNAFFLLESLATERLLLQEAYRSGYGKKGEKDELLAKYLNQKVRVNPPSEEELKKFYLQQKDTIGERPFEEVREILKGYLFRQKRQEAVNQHIQMLGRRAAVQLNEEWVEAQSLLARDNPVDRARFSGKPSLVDFGATGCRACDLMTPILADLERKYKDQLNVIFIHVGREQILGARYGIQAIPVQVFFDKTGKEVFRHTGFFSQKEIEKKLSEMGIS